MFPFSRANFKVNSASFSILADRPSFFSLLIISLAGILLSSCTTIPPDEKKNIRKSSQFTRVDFSSITPITTEDWDIALSSFRNSCSVIRKQSFLKEACRQAYLMQYSDAESFFKKNFEPWQIKLVEKDIKTGDIHKISDSGLMTGYYEPSLKVSSKKTTINSVPILATPEDLITVDLASLYPQLKGLRLRGKLKGNRLVPYDNRKNITKRRDLDENAIAWSHSPADVFFLQIQGSGRLEFADGSMIRVGYDNQNGHPYKAIGSWLIRKGYLKKDQVSMQTIRSWIKNNPKRVDELLNQNPSFVFFKVQNNIKPDQGPIGAQGIPLTAQASIAVDPKHVPLGTPLIVHAYQDSPFIEFTRPVIAQDTGGAIKGILRFDYFWGSGKEAGEKAGTQKSTLRAWILLPRGTNPEDIGLR